MAATLITGPKELNYNSDPIWVVVETDLIDASGNVLEPNLSLYMQLFQYGSLVAELNLVYDRRTRRATVNLSEMFDVKAVLPDDVATTSNSAHGQILGTLADIAIAFNDMYGEPATVPSSLIIIDGYYVIHGSTPYWYGIGGSEQAKLLHSYVHRNGRYVVKKLRRGQPEWLYILVLNEGIKSVQYEIRYTDGTVDTGYVIGTLPYTSAVAYVQVGYEACGAYGAANPNKDVNLYVVTVEYTNRSHESIYYHIDDHDTSHDEYLAYDNGIGGIEVIRCSGRHKVGVVAKREYYKKPIVIGSNHRDGEYEIKASGAKTMRLNTGYHSSEYIEHIAQILMGPVFYIDMRRNKIESIYVTDNSIDLIDRNDDLHAIEFEIKWPNRRSLNTMLQ